MEQFKEEKFLVRNGTCMDSKTEVSVLPNEFEIVCSNSHKGATAEIVIFCQNVAWHKNVCAKATHKVENISDSAEQAEQY